MKRAPIITIAAVVTGCALTLGTLGSISVRPAHAAFPGKNGKIAFEGKPRSIHTIRPDGSHQRRLTRNGGEPAFSASGKRIAFEHRGDIWVMRAPST
jgi:hypothetical protein